MLLCLLRFTSCSLKEVQTVFIQSSPRYKLCLFSMLSKANTVEIEYPQRIWSLIFDVEEFCGLFVHSCISLIKDSISA